MLILSINTVGPACEALLFENGVVVARECEPMQRGHDVRLAAVVDTLMSASGRELAQVARIAVVCGPGSFTGVRVGVAFARGLALALDVDAVGINSLEASLGDIPARGRTVVALAAKRRPPELSWWAQAFEDGVAIGDPEEADTAHMRRMIAHADCLAGEGLAPLTDDPGHLKVMDAAPHAGGAARVAQGILDVKAYPPRPVYVREPDAKPMKAAASPRSHG